MPVGYADGCEVFCCIWTTLNRRYFVPVLGVSMSNSPKHVLARILTSFLKDGGSHYWSDPLPEIHPMPGNCELKGTGPQ